MPMRLTPLGEGEPVAIDKAVTFFGRHPDCDVVLSTSRKVSRKHCCIAQINDYVVVRDLGSMNGVRVNGEEVRPAARLNPGDELWIGDVGFRFEPGVVNKKANGQSPPPGGEGVRKVTPEMLSRESPVAIPENGADFIVEESDVGLGTPAPSRRPKKSKPGKPRDDVIELSEDDLVE